jgi:hypothetical protein
MNEQGAWRTTAFEPIDMGAFGRWLDSLDGMAKVMLVEENKLFLGYEEPNLPNYRDSPLDEEEGEGDREFDFLEELSCHLREGVIVLILASGHGKLRYVFGDGFAIRNPHFHEHWRSEVNLLHTLVGQIKDEGWGDTFPSFGF